MSGNAMLRISRPVYEGMLEHALGAPAVEVCGLLGADASGMAVSRYSVDNVAAEPRRRFLMQAQGQIAAMRSMRERGETLLAIYHSHPDGTPRPSAQDVEDAQYPDTWYLIVVTTPAPAVHAFRWSAGGFIAVGLTVQVDD